MQTANIPSTKINTEKAKRLLTLYAKTTQVLDPNMVTKKSSDLAINLIAQHCNYDRPQVLSYESVSALFQGFRHLESSFCHRASWNPTAPDGNKGNPLVNNEDLNRFRKAYGVTLGRHGLLKHRARPITAGIICNLAEHFRVGKSGVVCAENILLHSILVIGVHLGLRYDDILELSYDHVRITTNNVKLTIPAACKNTTKKSVQSQIVEWMPRSKVLYNNGSIYGHYILAAHSLVF